MRTIVDWIHRGAVALSAAALAVVALVVAFQIIGRYVPAIPRALWTEEIARMGLLWLVFLGAAAAIRTSEHFIIDLIPDRFSDRTLQILATIGLLLVAIVSVMLFLGALSFVQTGTGRTSTTLGTSLVYSYAAPLVASVLMVLFTVEVWWSAIKDPRNAGLRNREAELEVQAADVHEHPDSGDIAARRSDS